MFKTETITTASNGNTSSNGANLDTFYSVYWDTDMSCFFEFDDVTYRIIAEDGLVMHDKTNNEYIAVTARDTAIFSLLNDGVRSSMAYDMLKNLMTGLTDNYPQPYGFYASVPDGSSTSTSATGYDRVTVDNIEPKVWSKGTGVTVTVDKNKKYSPHVYQMFGLDSTGTSCNNEYPALGMEVTMPLYYQSPIVGLTISKTVTNTGDEYADMEWQFQVVLDLSNVADSGEYKVTDGDGNETTYDSFAALQNALADPIVLKSGQKYTIEGLPEGVTYTITELTDDEDAEWKTMVSDSGAESTDEVEATETSGAIPEGGVANVAFKNTKAGGEAHLIVDYNLPGATATYDEETGLITSTNIVECGTHAVGDMIPISAAFNGTTLEPGITSIQLGTFDGVAVYATFQGLFTAPTGGTALTYNGGGQFEYMLQHEDLTVIYAQWLLNDTPTSGVVEGGEGQLYTVFFDYNYDGGGVTSALAGKYTYEGEVTIFGVGSGIYKFELPILWSYPDPPVREGWNFIGWSLNPTATTGTPTPADPGTFDTYYGVWESQDTCWDANGGIFEGGETRMWYEPQVYPRGEFVPVLQMQPTRTGYTFNGWYLDENCTQPLESYEEGIQPGRFYYAGWTAEKVIVTYYDTRQGTGVIIRQDEYNYNDIFELLEGMNDTDGWTFEYWATLDSTDVTSWDETMYLNEDTPLQYHEGGDVDDGSVMSDKGYWTLDLYAIWNENTTSYTLDLVWNDFQNNDGARPTTVTVGLVDSYMNNEVIQTNTVDVDPTADKQTIVVFTNLPVEDNDASVQKRTYKLVFLGYTDYWGTYYEMSAPAIDGDQGVIDVQTVSLYDNRTLTQYAYGVNNYGSSSNNSANTGYEEGNYYTIITFDHALITTGDDIKFTIQWDDDSNNDGVRPQAVTLVLYADGVPVYERPWHNSQTGVGSVSAALCEVTDDGDTWTYIFRDYQKYHEGKAITYTVAVKNEDRVTTFDQNDYTVKYLNSNDETIGDENGCFISRPIEYQEVPISIIWNDENNRDGQRPEYVSVALMAYQWNDYTFRWEYEEIATQVVRTDDLNHMTASEWTATFGEQKVYNDGLKRIYHLVVLSDLNEFIPEGSFQYGWVESLYGNQREVNGNDRNGALRNPVAQVMISQNTNTVSVTGNIYWDDSQNNDNIRPVNVILQLYAHAPGETPEPVEGQEYRVTLCGISCSQVPTPIAGLPDLR